MLRYGKLGDWLASFAVQAVAQHVGSCIGYHVLIFWKCRPHARYWATKSERMCMFVLCVCWSTSQHVCNVSNVGQHFGLADMLAEFVCSV